MSSISGRLPLRLRLDYALDVLLAATAHGATVFIFANAATAVAFLAGQWRSVDTTVAVGAMILAELLCLVILALQARAGLRSERAEDRRHEASLELSRARFAVLRLEREREELDTKSARLEALVLSAIRVRQEHQRGSTGTSDAQTLARIFDLLDGRRGAR